MLLHLQSLTLQSILFLCKRIRIQVQGTVFFIINTLFFIDQVLHTVLRLPEVLYFASTQWIVPFTFSSCESGTTLCLRIISTVTTVTFPSSSFSNPVHFTKYAFIRRTSLPGNRRKYFFGGSSIKSSRSI